MCIITMTNSNSKTFTLTSSNLITPGVRQRLLRERNKSKIMVPPNANRHRPGSQDHISNRFRAYLNRYSGINENKSFRNFGTHDEVGEVWKMSKRFRNTRNKVYDAAINPGVRNLGIPGMLKPEFRAGQDTMNRQVAKGNQLYKTVNNAVKRKIEMEKLRNSISNIQEIQNLPLDIRNIILKKINRRLVNIPQLRPF